jgi:hypothetical protein
MYPPNPPPPGPSTLNNPRPPSPSSPCFRTLWFRAYRPHRHHRAYRSPPFFFQKPGMRHQEWLGKAREWGGRVVRPIMRGIGTSTYLLEARQNMGLQFTSDGEPGVCFGHKEAENVWCHGDVTVYGLRVRHRQAQQRLSNPVKKRSP